MRTKKKTVEQEKNRNNQKSVKSVRLMGVGVYGSGKDFWKRYVFSLEWKSEGVIDDDSGDSEDSNFWPRLWLWLTLSDSERPFGVNVKTWLTVVGNNELMTAR